MYAENDLSYPEMILYINYLFNCVIYQKHILSRGEKKKKTFIWQAETVTLQKSGFCFLFFNQKILRDFSLKMKSLLSLGHYFILLIQSNFC